MQNKITVLMLCAVIFVLCSSADAQQTGKVFRIGFLDGSTASGMAVLAEAFRQELSKLGWIEGKNIIIEYRFAEQKNDRLPELAADLVGLKVDLIVAGGGTSAMRKESDYHHSHRYGECWRPRRCRFGCQPGKTGRQRHGVASLGTELNTKRLEILKDTLRKLAAVGLLRPAGGSDRQLKDLRPAALALKLKLEEIETQLDARDLESAFQTAKQKQAGAIMTTSSRPFFAERKRFVELASKHRLPAIYVQKEYVDEGGLMSYGADFDDLYRHAAVYVDKILKGAKPADLPVQQATKFEFVINLKAAKEIGLIIPLDARTGE